MYTLYTDIFGVFILISGATPAPRDINYTKLNIYLHLLYLHLFTSTILLI